MKKGNDDLILSIHTILKYGIRLTLPDGVILYTNINNEIIHENNGIKDYIDEDELREVLRGINFWSMENGRFIDVNYMSNDHLKNAINLQEKKLEVYPGSIMEEVTTREINILKSVLRNRNIDSILEDEDYGLDNIL